MEEDPNWSKERQRMVTEQLAGRDIQDPRVLDAMQRTPRHLFVPSEHRSLAYADGPLPIGDGQTISQPYIVAFMTELLELKGNEKVLEVGTGSGYQAAVLALLAEQVFTIERYPDLASSAAQVFQLLELNNIYLHVGDGSQGWPDKAPFDAIVVTAAAPGRPRALLDQLVDGGRMVIPVGGRRSQVLERWLRRGDEFEREDVLPVAFVPLRGRFGWDSDDGESGEG